MPASTTIEAVKTGPLDSRRRSPSILAKAPNRTTRDVASKSPPSGSRASSATTTSIFLVDWSATLEFVPGAARLAFVAFALTDCAPSATCSFSTPRHFSPGTASYTNAAPMASMLSPSAAVAFGGRFSTLNTFDSVPTNPSAATPVMPTSVERAASCPTEFRDVFAAAAVRCVEDVTSAATAAASTDDSSASSVSTTAATASTRISVVAAVVSTSASLTATATWSTCSVRSSANASSSNSSVFSSRASPASAVSATAIMSGALASPTPPSASRAIATTVTSPADR